MKHGIWWVALLGSAICANAEESPDYRLPAAIEPLSQQIELRLDPTRSDYTGTTSIALHVSQATDRIGINQVGLTLDTVELSSATGSRVLEATDGNWERSWLADGKPIAVGDYTLRIDFSGKYATDSLGMHRVSFEGNDYVYTQMEAMYARRAFPAFDEPAFKIPFRLIIETPMENTAVSNTPVESKSEQDGWQRVTFMETRPLPSYLVAYAVGPMDRAALDGMSIPGHVYVPRGHAGELGFVLRETPTIIAALEDYFGSRYSYRKLDFVAVPEFAFGAMENPGMITYRTDLLMVGDEVAGQQAMRVLMVIAHEAAHIWYGDLVTMAWWNDLWLNEAFATWMSNTILEKTYPEYETQLRLPQAEAFVTDQLTTSTAIRREVRNTNEIWASIRLNYSKGHALLSMLERYVGPAVWQRAIREYMNRFAWSNATEADLWAVVSDVSGVNISGIAGDYLDQPGFAMISVDESGAVSQRRYVRQGLEVDDELWHIPMTVRYKSDGQVRQTFLLLKDRTGTLDMPDDTDWIFPDAGGNGYYRWQVDAEQYDKLVDDLDELSEREKIALLDNSEALLNAGTMSMVQYLETVSRLLQDSHPLVILSALTKVQSLGEEFITESNRAAFAAFIDRSLSGRLAEVGVKAHEGDTAGVVQLRPLLLRIVGQFGADQDVLTQAAALADAYLESPATVQTQLAAEALRVTALNDDGSRYDDYLQAYLDSDAADQKSTILSAMYFKAPDVVRRHLEFSLSEEVQAGDSITGLTNYAEILADQTPLYEWLADNLDQVVAKSPSYKQPLLPQYLGGSCSKKNLDLLTEFFEDRGDIYAPSLARAAEAEQTCIARRNRYAGGFEQFIADYPAREPLASGQ